MIENATPPTYAFGGFHLDSRRRVLSRALGEPIPLPPKALDTLLYLVERAGAVVDKRELLSAIWPHVVVEENNLNQTISTLRRILGETPGEHRFIVTEPNRGYRFVAAVAAPKPSEDLDSHSVVVPEEPMASADRDGTTSRWGYAAAAVLLLLIVAGLAGYFTRERESVLPNSIAVLPFDNLSPSAEHAYFAAGIHEEILNQLYTLSSLNVIARLSVLQYADRQKSIPEIARELNVQTVMEGTVRYADNRIRITVQLIDGRTNTHLWSETYEREFADVFVIESDIAVNVANALNAQFSAAEQAALETPPTTSPAAYTAYLRALSAADRLGSPSGEVVLSDLEEAIALDPRFAAAHAQRAVGYVNRLIASVGVAATVSSERAELIEATRAAARTALELDPESSSAHHALGRLHELHWRWTEASKEYGTDVGSALDERLQRAALRAYLGDYEEAIRRTRDTLRFYPGVAQAYWGHGVAYAYAGRADAALTAVREAARLTPDGGLYHIWVAHVEGILGNNTAAIRELRIAEQLFATPLSSITIANLAYAYAWNGHHDDARRLVDQLAKTALDRQLDAGNWIMAYLAVGDKEKAAEAFQMVLQNIAAERPDAGYLTLGAIRSNMYRDPVLDEPRFVALRAQLRGR